MSDKQEFGFQTEVKQLLHLVIHSLYSNKEIFLRELISNASDASEKLRFEALSNANVFEDDADLHVRVSFDKEAKTISIADNGIGMTKEEAIEHLGTIAKSGTKRFLDSLTGDQSKDSQLIGQFGVGFYSAYIVADKVTVNSRKAGQNANEAVRWESKADGSFTVETITKEKRGTEIVLHLKDSEEALLDAWKLKEIITKYSDHISLPIQMIKVDVDKDGKETVTDEWETINKAKALWTRSKSDISEEDYKEFYKHISHDFSDPLTWSHNKVEGNLEYTSLLYLPERAPFDLWDRERKSGLQLYVQRVFIMENENLLPSYLRFVKGVIDTNDLPLNISREILQHNRVVEKIKKATTKKVLDMIAKMAQNEPEKYDTFWKAFGQVIKEAPSEDQENKEKVAKLLRFASTHQNTANQEVSLEEYVARMKEGQKHIYFVTAESFNAAKNNPQLEIFRKKDIEVLLMYDRVDEWMTSHLSEFDGKTLKSIAKGDLDLGELDSDEDKKEQEKVEKDFESIIKQMKEVLKEKVEDVRISKRLTDSPSCIVVNDYGMSMHLQKMMADAGQMMMPGMGGKPVLEVNPEHRFVEHLKEEQDDEKFADWSNILLQQALLTEGAQLDDPAEFVKLTNKYLTA
ncbi:molecular chaperone HtpG [Fangia hongkongensis]|uniref:molecular chaperone HtpG n=1 Tax=Fangia hongkongensis TaxID=270495 RepID=UPI00035F0711|nr:molecular chaperone HtpG [Fangia hongkongensis]MBK2126356.1 molecular chaperone HtpG [Fangia hongkongensis]